MNYLAATDLTELSVLLGAIFGAFGAILVGFYKYANAREKDFAESRDNQTKAFEAVIDKLGEHLESNTQAVEGLRGETRSMRKVHEQGYKEAEQRNGHLAELTIQARDDVVKVINKIDKQQVKEQTIEHQHVKNKE